MPHIYSTLSNNQRYDKYVAGGADLPRIERSVVIAGGANVADKHFITPRGVVTTVTDDDYELLKENKLFNTHLENGYITVEERKADVEKVIAGMTGRDESAPLVEADYETTGKPAPTSKRK